MSKSDPAMGDSTKCQSEDFFFPLNVRNSRNFSVIKVQDQNSFVKNMKSIIPFFKEILILKPSTISQD